MSQAVKIEERTKDFIEAYNTLKEDAKFNNNKELASILGIKSVSTISEILAMRQNIQPDVWKRFKEHFNISEKSVSQGTKFTEETLTQIEEPVSYVKKRHELKNSSDRKRKIPFYDADAQGGLVETEMTPIHAPAGTIDVGDLLNDSEAAIRIYGNSMIPNYPPGCVVGLARVEKGFIQPG